MTLDQLRAFSAVVEFGSVRAASSKVFKSSPSISASIKALESYLEVQLFSRKGYRLVLTEEGKVFHKKAEQVLHSAAELTSLSRLNQNKRKQTISIAVTAYFPASSVISIVSKMNEVFPDMHLHMTTENQARAVQSLFDNDAELAISPISNSVNENIEVKYLKTVPMVCVVRADSELAKLAHPIVEDEISGFPHVVCTDGNITHPDRVEFIPHQKRFWVNDINTKHAFIQSGLGWGQLPEHIVNDEINSGKLVKLDIKNHSDNAIELFLVRRTDKPLGNIAQIVWENLQSHLV